MAPPTLWQRIAAFIGPAVPTERTVGRPPSANGASSFHLIWDTPGVFSEASAVIEVVQPPTEAKLYFWALQVSFVEPDNERSTIGGAHVGLQHHPQYPDGGAVCWGGYRHGAAGSGELDGSALGAPSALRNPNTCNYGWQAGRRYRYRVFSPEAGRWRATISDLESGDEFVIRDLYSTATACKAPMVWTESFADCDDPSVTIRWSELSVTRSDGTVEAPAGIRLNYQTVADGGCSNTASTPDGDAWLQTTNTARV